WMGAGVVLEDFQWLQMSVALGAVQAHMPEHGLHVADVGAAGEEMGSEAVTQGVRPQTRKSSCTGCLVNHLVEASDGDAPPAAGYEEGGLLWGTGHQRTGLDQIRIQAGLELGAYRHQARLPVLGDAYPEGRSLRVVVVHVQPLALLAAKASAVEDLQHGP